MKTACALTVLIIISGFAAHQRCFFCSNPLQTDSYEVLNGFGEVLGWACRECHEVVRQ